MNKEIERIERIAEDIFTMYKLNFTLKELLRDRSILLAYELSQSLGGAIKVGDLYCKLNNKPLHVESYYWCSISNIRIDPVMKYYHDKILNSYLDNVRYPNIQEISLKVADQYDQCFEIFLNYKD